MRWTQRAHEAWPLPGKEEQLVPLRAGEPLLRAGQGPEAGMPCQLFLMARSRRMASV